MTIDNLTEDIAMPEFMVVNHLPEQGEPNIIYIKSGMMWVYLDCWTQVGMAEHCSAETYEKFGSNGEIERLMDEVNNLMVVEEKRGKCPNCGAPLENGHCHYCGCA